MEMWCVGKGGGEWRLGNGDEDRDGDEDGNEDLDEDGMSQIRRALGVGCWGV